MARFDDCLAFVWRRENDGQPFHVAPGDSGGATAWSVTLGTYAAWRAVHGQHTTTAADLKAATKTELSAILYSWYWSAISLDRFPVGPDLLVFDVAITAGPKRSAEMLQSVLGIHTDGLVGPETLAAVAAEQPDDLIAKLAERYTQFYKSLGKPQFVRGWLRRSGDCEKLALATLARGTANV